MTSGGPLRSRSKARALLLAGLVVCGATTACSFIPRTVEGLDPLLFTALPLRGWIHNEDVTVRALAGCFAPDCPRVAVGLITARGRDGEILSALLDDPQPLLRAIAEADGADTGKTRSAIRTIVTVEPASAGRFRGFLLTMQDEAGRRPPAVALAAGRRVNAELEAVMVVGFSAEAVRSVAAGVVRDNFP